MCKLQFASWYINCSDDVTKDIRTSFTHRNENTISNHHISKDREQLYFIFYTLKAIVEQNVPDYISV